MVLYFRRCHAARAAPAEAAPAKRARNSPSSIRKVFPVSEQKPARLVRGQATLTPARVVLMILTTVLLIAASGLLLAAAAPGAQAALWWAGWAAIVAAIGASYALWRN